MTENQQNDSDPTNKITPQEREVFNFISEMLKHQVKLILDLEMYKEAVIHGHDINTRTVTKQYGGFQQRKRKFPNATRYDEICFISSNSETSTINDKIEKSYTHKINIGINHVGIAIFPMKSGRSIVVILIAFIPPTLSEESFDEFFSLAEDSPISADGLLKIINDYRNYIKLGPLEPHKLEFSSQPMHISQQWKVASSKMLFGKLYKSLTQFPVLNEIWSNFGMQEEKKGECTIIRFGFVHNGFNFQLSIYAFSSSPSLPSSPKTPQRSDRTPSPVRPFSTPNRN